MPRRIRVTLAVAGVAMTLAPSLAAQQPAPASLVPRVQADSAPRSVGALGIDRAPRSVGTAQQTVRGDALTAAGETNVISALAGRVAGADVSGTGASGSTVSLLLRGARTPDGADEPLFVVDGVPVANEQITGMVNTQIDYGSTLGDIDLNSIASVTILDGPNAAALYGSRAQNGAVLITTKSAAGTRGFDVTARQDYTFESPVALPVFQTRYASGDNGVYESGGIGTWGPAVFGTQQVQWWSNGQPALLISQPNNIRDFLVQGHTSTTTAAVSAASARGDVRLGITKVGQDGLEPNSGDSRLNTSVSAGMAVLPRLRIRVSGQYAHADADNQPTAGLSNDAALTAFLLTGSVVDVTHLRTDALTNHDDAFASSFGFNNPYWDAFDEANGSARDHAIGVISADYEVSPWLTASIRTGIDWWHDHEHQREPVRPTVPNDIGFSAVGGTNYREQNSDLLVSVAHSLSRSVGMTVDAGVATRGGKSDQAAIVTDDFGRIIASFTSTRAKTNSAYGRAGLSLDSTVFVDATGRKDWRLDGSEFYPSVSAAYEFVRRAPNGTPGGLLSAGKLRASWAQVGGEQTFSLVNHTDSWEGGADLGFLHDRMTLSATYYDERTLSRVFTVGLGGPTTGQSEAISDRGLELSAGATVVERGDGLRWDLDLRVGANRSRVATSTRFGADRHVSLVDGEPFGSIYADVQLRDSLGRPLVQDGLPIMVVAPRGSELPSWVGGLESDLRYKHLALMVLVDSRHGGHVYSNTNFFGATFGTLTSTLPLRQHVADDGQIIVPGVTTGGTPNTTPVTPEVYYEYMASTAPYAVYDASELSLSEVRLGYQVDGSLAARLHLTRFEVAAIGRNLLRHSAAPNFDPQSVLDTGPTEGVEGIGIPSTRSIGLTLQITP